MDFWNDKNERYRFKMVDVYNEQIKDLIKIVPDFKIANATIHFDEISPHMHIVGVPVSYDCKRGMKKQVVKSKLLIEIRSTDTIRISIYAIKYTYTPRIVSSFTFFPFTFTILTAFGWIIVFSSRRMLFARIRSLDTLIPPPVEPAEAPITITRSRTHLESSGHLLKSAVTNPVVVITDATWNTA